MLKTGDKIPLFTLPNSKGENIAIADYIGKKNLVIYFYPKDETPGCTAQACSFRDNYEEFTKLNAEVIGISFDSIASHSKFASKFQLPFILLSDNDKQVAKLFGIPRTFFILPGRVTFVVNKSGVIVHTFNSLNQAEKHIDEALAHLIIQ